MREEVLVLPPSCVSDIEESAFNISAPGATSVERPSHVVCINRGLASSSVQQAQRETLQGELSFQWGSLKRKRSDRGISYHRKPSLLTSQVNLEQMQVSAVSKVSSSIIGEGAPHLENAEVQEKDLLCSSPAIDAEHADVEEACNRELCLSQSDSREGRSEVTVQRGKKRSLHVSQQQPLQQNTHASLESKLVLPVDRHAAALIEAGLVKKDFTWPKFMFKVCQKELEEDLLFLKDVNPSQQPKRRSRAVEKTLRACTPGNWLSSVSSSHYIVRKKKGLQGNPGACKAVDSHH